MNEQRAGDRCYAAALRLLQYRWNSAAELRRKLRTKKYEPAEIEQALERLLAEGWIDDARFATALVRTLKLRRLGPGRLAGQLAAAGVERGVAERAISENRDASREREDLLALCRKKMTMIARRYGQPYLWSAEGRKKLTGYLLRQGYDAGLVRAVVDEQLGGPSEVDS